MASFYSLVQYIPDLVRDERINIGVVAFTDGNAEVHFIENWDRVRLFGGNVSVLQTAARQIERMPYEALRQAMDGWSQSIQFTLPAASVLAVDSLLIDVAKRCLVDPERPKKSYRNRQQAIDLTKRYLGAAMRNEIGSAANRLLKEGHATFGKLDKHECDLTVMNGHTLLLANSLSFETPDVKAITKMAHATAWAIDDIKQSDPSLPFAVVALPPKQPLEIYDRATETFQKLGAQVVEERSLDGWSRATAIAVREKVRVA